MEEGKGRLKVDPASIHLYLAVLWVVLLLPTVLWWSKSILWVLVISIYANVVGHWSAYESAKTDAKSRQIKRLIKDVKDQSQGDKSDG